MKTGIANLPLHYGKAPSWLFQRMKRLAREISLVIIDEFGPEEMLRKLSDPFWFQAFGCILGFDWHSSGLTTTVCGALKEGTRGIERDIGLFVAGGKGKFSRQTPHQIEEYGNALSLDPQPLVYASRMSAKVDSAAVQDGYQLYHHTFIFTARGNWTVIQQGMNETNRYARRYHWLSDTIQDFVCEPHQAVCCDQRGETLNLVAQESKETRKASTIIACENPDRITSELRKIKELDLPKHHEVLINDINPERLKKILIKTHEKQPDNFEHLLGIEGVGPKTVRSLSLISELIYGAKPSFRDPARFSFAHGGKDGHPYPVDRKNYDLSIEILRKSIRSAKLGEREKIEALKRLSSFTAI
ncbi:MAG: DUF763 domain-containing protein [Proteobacteria bacterium]|nr:DUF763 domain-containing protein [Pseudomonadota bacterium]